MNFEKENDGRNKKFELSYLELKRYYDSLIKANNQIDQKMMYMFSSLGIILTLFGFSEFDNYIIHDVIYILFFVVIGLDLLIFLTCFFMAIFPKNQPFPIEASFDSINQVFYEKECLDDVYYQININYIQQIKIIRKINKKKSQLLRISMITYSLILIFSLVLIVIF